MISRSVSALLAAVFLWLGTPALADRLVVVELFTSQGCSSCPPADEFLGELATRDDVLPLALHVDYWDYIGWKDSFASPAHTNRQRGYARAAGARSIYTPQVVVDGYEHVIGHKPMKLAMLISKLASKSAPVTARARRTGASVEVSVEGRPSGTGPLDVVLVRYHPEETVKIRRGENAGRNLTYHNIVREMRLLGRWDGVGTFRVRADASAPGHYAVLVQRKDHGRILAAARAR